MLRDLKIFRRNSEKIPPAEGSKENLPTDPPNSSISLLESDPSRPPLNTIQEPLRNPKLGPDQETILRRKTERTPSKNQTKGSSDAHLPFRTPEKPAASKNRFGWVPKSEPGSNCGENGDESCHQGPSHLRPLSRGGSLGNGAGYSITTPRTYRTAGRASSVHSDSSSTQSTPTKSVTKPTCSGFGSSRPPVGVGMRMMNFSGASKGIPMSLTTPPVFIAAEVPHFELREDPSFWMDHNVQVVIRVRPLNSTECSLQGYSRCLKQESAQSITWIGQPETRFTFDYVACETVNQEMLFRVAGLPMVENCMSGYNSCIFAYGQTGSGKTYTMLGEICESELRPSAYRGMTPRIFEFLFARIRAEEENRRDEKLKYNCKCSFLEIYNEQITDLLDPSSTNLLLREDLRKGVYVENLSEFEVETVNDILKLLFQGAANRKVAATNMNRESSRSHSVFTCVIESRWEKDSTTNLRFARLNLVDLAGSERQKTSGAEGERLKEAANINKSLSTLGHVIMVLADVAHGKQRHVPYRDSRLTFLLQDSLGGNSKTMIIANVSPSICSANETLSTLKFAQRAKLVQNNAIVNEDASGDMIALQHQIRLLKEELFVLKRQNVSRSLSFHTTIIDDSEVEGCNASVVENLSGMAQVSADELYGNEASCSVRVSTKQLKSLEATLAGALRREKMADTTIKQHAAEIEQLNRLVRQREEDTRCSKMMLKFREDKIQRMEALLDGQVPPDSYLLEENNALSEEIQLLREKVDRNPEVTRFALENIRLLDQLRRFQDFYEEGERELLLAEVSDLRNQLIQILDWKSEQDQHPKPEMEPPEAAHPRNAGVIRDNESLHVELKKTSQELEDCRNKLKSCLEINARLTREINDLHIELTDIKSASHDQHGNVEPESLELCSDLPHPDPLPYTMKHAEEILNLQLELDILKTILGEEKLSRIELEGIVFHGNNELKAANERVLQISKHHEDLENELRDARSVIEALESQQFLSINELEELRESNNQFVELLKKQELEISILRKQLSIRIDGEKKLPSVCELVKDHPLKHSESNDSPLQEKLKRMQASLEKAWSLNMRFQSDQASQTSLEQEMDEVRRQVEVETTEVIVCLQEEIIMLQQRVDDSNRNELLAKQSMMILETEIKGLYERLYTVTQENGRLGGLLEEKERDMRSLTEDWERLAYEIAEVLADGNAALEDASDQVAYISDSFPDSSWVTEQVGKMIRNISERDLLIEELQKCLEDAQNVRCDMEWKLRSLRGATLAMTEAQQQESSDKEREILQLTSQLSEKMSIITELENNIKLGEERLRKAEICATVAFTTVNRLSEINAAHRQALEHVKLKYSESAEIFMQKDALLHDQISFHADAERQIQALKTQLEKSRERTAKLLKQLEQSQEKEQAEDLEHQLKEEEEDVALLGDDLLKAKMELKEFKMGVSMLHSCMSEYAELVSSRAEEYTERADYVSEHRIWTEPNEDIVGNEQHNVQSVSGGSMDDKVGENGNKSECGWLSEDILDRDTTIVLLRRELESALESLKGVQAQMVKLLDEKEENKKSKIHNEKSIEHLTVEVLRLKSEIIDREQQFELRLQELEEKLQTVEGNAMASSSCWRKAKEGLELDISEAKAIAAQKTVEASILLNKIEEVQETMREADVMVNALMEANETAKLEIEKHKKIETTLNHERSCLISEVQALQSSLDVKEQEYESVEKNLRFNLTEARRLVMVLEDAFRHLQGTFTEKLNLIACDLDWLKSQLHHHTHLSRAWLEETWSEIIGKDCAVSVLHLCHMGILLERITGLNAENGFLYRGLCESNSVITDLREHNVKAKKELEVCSNLKGKLLVDINNSFNRITKKEDETTEFRARLHSFEKKILHLQLQEESMLDRSNSMGTELAILMKELDANNRNALTAASAQEKLLREKEELYNQLGKTSKLLDEVQGINETLRDSLYENLDLIAYNSHPDSLMKFNDVKACNTGLNKVSEFNKFIKCQIESVMVNMFGKDFELLVLASELEQKNMKLNRMASQKLDLERQRDTFSRVIEKINKENILNKIDLELKNSEMYSLLVENEKLKNDLLKLKEDNSIASEDLREAKIGFASSLRHASVVDEENHKLQDTICSLEACVTRLQTDLDRKCAELDLISKELDLKNEVTEIQIKKTNAIVTENDSLKNELMAFMQGKDEISVMLNFKLRHCSDLAQSVGMAVDRMFHVTDGEIVLLMHRMSQEICEHQEMASKFVDELEFLELSAKELMSQNLSLQSELMRKDEVLKGLLFDLSLLQESASVAKDQEDELEEMAARLESLEDELATKSGELNEAVAHIEVLEAQFLEKNEKIASLELELSEKCATLNMTCTENHDLKACMEHILEMRNTIEEELTEKIKVAERLEEELLEMSILHGQRNRLLEDLQKDMPKLADERDHLASEVLVLKEQVEMTQALAEENEAIATEARQIAEGRKAYAEDKEEEIKLLERSVEELECTVNALQNKVEIINGEAERQRLQREELEMELEIVRHKMLTVPASCNIWNVTEGRNFDKARHLKEGVTEPQEAQHNVQVLQKQVADKDAEIVQCKAHISELNMHAEAQAREYKQKFKELEAMAQQVKADTAFSNATSLTSTKSEKTAVKSRGSGSPFKCIGLGLAQQMNSEKDEELTAAKRQIEELEALAANRQKEIFMLNTRLAAAESMTHDVIRDLLGVKLDMTSYALQLDHQQVRKFKETVQFDSQEYQEKDQTVAKLKKELNEFIEERQSWLDEITQRHTEMVAARIALEKLRQREQFLSTENEMLKVDNAKYKKVVMELEDEIKMLSEQQNLQQRIHHHAKIKEENSLLRIQNEDLTTKLQRSEAILSRVKEELAHYRAACGKKPYVDIDAEEQLRKKLDDSEEERIQLAQKLLSLCANILKVAGLSHPSSTISPSAAEDALHQLKDQINSLESEVQDLKVKSKLSCAKIRLLELKQQQFSPMQENSPSPVPRLHVYHHHDEAIERG